MHEECLVTDSLSLPPPTHCTITHSPCVHPDETRKGALTSSAQPKVRQSVVSLFVCLFVCFLFSCNSQPSVVRNHSENVAQEWWVYMATGEEGVLWTTWPWGEIHIGPKSVQERWWKIKHEVNFFLFLSVVALRLKAAFLKRYSQFSNCITSILLLACNCAFTSVAAARDLIYFLTHLYFSFCTCTNVLLPRVHSDCDGRIIVVFICVFEINISSCNTYILFKMTKCYLKSQSCMCHFIQSTFIMFNIIVYWRERAWLTDASVKLKPERRPHSRQRY